MLVERLEALRAALAGPAWEAERHRIRATVAPDQQAAAWHDAVEELARPVGAALRALAAAARGPDWPEQSWDSYRHDHFVREEWCVTVPFGALRHAASPIVPIAAAERILGLPEGVPDGLQPWEHLPPGRFYRRYWAESKGHLALVADLAARWPDDGGEALARALLTRVRRLGEVDRTAVELHLAAVGLLDLDLAPLLVTVLQSAATEELGSRGELVLHALRRAEDLPADQREPLLRQALEVARRTTAFVASNPYAAAAEQLAEAAVGSLTELRELVERAARLRSQDWAGWDRSLTATSRCLTRLAHQYGEPGAQDALALLERYRYTFPAIRPLVLLASGHGLPPPLGERYVRQALAEARGLRRTADGGLVEAQAARYLAELPTPDGADELRATAARLTPRVGQPAARAGLLVAIQALTDLETGPGELLTSALAAASRLRRADTRCLAWYTIAAAPATPPEVALQAREQAERAARRWLLREPPFDILVPLLASLTSRLPSGPAHSAVTRTVRYAVDLAAGTLWGQRAAAELMTIGPSLAGFDGAVAVATVAEQLTESWWQLPLLALVGDATARWLARLVEAERAVR